MWKCTDVSLSLGNVLVFTLEADTITTVWLKLNVNKEVKGRWQSAIRSEGFSYCSCNSARFCPQVAHPVDGLLMALSDQALWSQIGHLRLPFPSVATTVKMQVLWETQKWWMADKTDEKKRYINESNFLLNLVAVVEPLIFCKWPILKQWRQTAELSVWSAPSWPLTCL